NRSRLLLASSSLAALLVGGGASSAVAGGASGYTNPAGQVTGCISVQNTSFTGNVVNQGTVTLGTPSTNVGILVQNASVAGGITNGGTISVSGHGILITGTTSAGGSGI